MRTLLLLTLGGLSLLGLPLAVGCGDGGAGGAGGSGGSGGTGGIASTSSSSSSGSGMTGVSDITGTVKNTWLTDTGEKKGIPALGSYLKAVYQNADKTFGSIDADYDVTTGDFVIKGVPEGPYSLEVLTDHGAQVELIAMTARSGLDLGEIRAGRPDAVGISKNPTTLTLDLTSLIAWKPLDYMELFSLGSNLGGDIMSPYVTPTKPMAGATSLTGFLVNVQQIGGGRLIDGAKGDEVVLTHLSDVGSSLTVTQALTLPSITLGDGQSTKTGGAFLNVAQHLVPVDFRISAFVGFVADAGPGVSHNNSVLRVYAEPGGQERSSDFKRPMLSVAGSLGTMDQTVALTYGNPFPATYGAIAQAFVSYRLEEKLPTPDGLDGAILVQAPVATFFQTPVVPTLSPPTSVTIAGKPITSDLTGVGVTPVIAWKAPAMGKPTSYRVTIVSFEPYRLNRANLITSELRVTVPPGVLEQGGRYAAIITASTELADFKAPFRRSPTFESADALTMLFSP